MKPDLGDDAFDEVYYLEANPDIASAVRDGAFTSAYDHYLQHGRREGRPAAPGARPTGIPGLYSHDFDEEWYLTEYPDVAEGVKTGAIASGYSHWLTSGRAEGRIAPPGYDEGTTFDAAWYLATYHAVRHDIETGRARDAQDHYARFGRYRGYLPNAFAPRPDNPAGFASHFGGFWVDQGNARDLIKGRLDLGRITEAEASLLEQWIAQGYVILPQALPADLVDRAAETLQRAYAGAIDGVLFECQTVGGYNPIAWHEAVQTNPAKALDLHWLSQDIRDLIFAHPIRSFLELVFDRRAMAAQSLTFLRGSAQGYHQDTLYVPFSLPTQFIASWVALEDVQPGGGELTYFTGSHRLPERPFANRYKTLWDAQRMLRRNSLREQMQNYSADLERASREANLTADRFMAKKGDVLLWHADLAHGGLPISNTATRSSVVTHYCPEEVAFLSFERGRTARRSHGGKAWYATGYYAEAS
jgi:phytanoyl-CoA hydroxylase